MFTVGNDILDLYDPENIRTFSRKGIEKFFSDKEKKNAEKNLNEYPYQKLWTLKESIYKCMLKHGFRLGFSPAMINLDFQVDRDMVRSRANLNQIDYFAYCYIEDDFVVSLATNSEMSISRIKSFFVKNENLDLYTRIADKIIVQNALESGEIIKTKDNIPIFITDSGSKYLDLSFSNEGKYYYVSYLPELMDVSDCKYLIL